MKKLFFIYLFLVIGTIKAQEFPEPNSNGQSFSCSPRKTCKKMKSCAEARYHFEQCGNKSLDRDRDGIPCENICS